VRFFKLFGLFSSLFILACTGPASSGTSTQEKVIIANSGSHALIIWDVTATAAELAARNTLDAGAIHDLELRSLKLVAASLDELPRAETISIRIVYRRVNASGDYGTQTFEGAVPIAELSMPIAIARANKGAWMEPHATLTFPAGIQVRTYDANTGS
jgi:hypothetical protein